MSDPKPPRWLKPVNKIRVGLQKLRTPTDPPMVLTVAGHKSGQPRSTPMTPFTLDGELYTVEGFPNAGWVLNARAAGSGTLSHGRTKRPVRIVELSAEAARPVLREFPVHMPVGVRFLKRAGLVENGTPDEVEALAGRISVFRFDPPS